MVIASTQSSNTRLLNKIEEKRTELLNLAAENGLTSYYVLKCSMELDQLINEIQFFELKDKITEVYS